MSLIDPRFHRNPSQRTPCMRVLDTSGSMNGEGAGGRRRIDELNRGLEALHAALLADHTAALRVQLALVRVGGPSDDAQLLMEWTDVADFVPPKLDACGLTPLGHGMRLALHHVDRHKVLLRQNGINYTRPWIMVISDGEPSDSPAVWEAVVQECRAAELARRCAIFPIGVEDAETAVLQQLSTTPVARLSTARFHEYFVWLSSSLEKLAHSRPGEAVVLPPTSSWAVFDGA
jgi:uncharacterized protein YegL